MLARLWSPAQIAVLGLRAEQAELAKSAGATSFGLADSQAGDQPDAGPDGFDLVIEAAGAVAAVQTAVSRVRRGGTVLLIGLPPHGQTVPLAADDLVNNDLRVVGSFSYTPAAWRGVLALLNSGQLKPGLLITHRYSLGDWERAVATLRGRDGPGRRGKVLIDLRKAPN
jgi:threonine dehydrogenase-like Zn-dependent dehydrogenase